MTLSRGDDRARDQQVWVRLVTSWVPREHVIDTVKAAFVQGRLTKDELDLRIGQTFASRTYSELAAVTADIPAEPTGARPLRKPVRARARPPMNKVVSSGACVAVGPAAVAVGFLAQNESLAKFLGVIVIVYFMAWLVAGAQMLDSWHQKRSPRAATAPASAA